jgi:TPR repeat protein
MRRLACLCIAVALLGGDTPLVAQVAPPDPDVVAGIRHVDEGDFEAALVPLGRAVRTLSGEASRPKELAEAHLYLGIAYVMLEQEKAGRASFREALALQKDLRLSPEEFPRKVLRAFEAAVQDAAAGASEKAGSRGMLETERRPAVPGGEPGTVDSFRRACDAGEADGCRSLGAMYELGLGVATDEARAAELYRQACQEGDALGCAWFGIMCANGLGVEKDVDRAAQLYRRACDVGNALGCTLLGVALEQGRGVTRNERAAVEAYRNACDREDANGCFRLAEAYANGIGVARDEARALELYRKACVAGNPGSCENAARLGGR